jgi:tetratricopeptide (TPR) repeat protein
MYTINIYLRFALIGLTLIVGIALSILFGFWYAFPFFLVTLTLLIGYILLGTIQSAAVLMQSGDLEATEKRLKLTLSPRLLYVTNRAYYYLIKGSVAMAQKKTEEGEAWLMKAQALNLPTDNEKAMIELQLASVHLNKSRFKQAEVHMRNLKQLKVTEPTLKEQVAQMEKVLSQQGQIKAAGRMGAFKGGQIPIKPGGKRRRPPMR